MCALADSHFKFETNPHPVQADGNDAGDANRPGARVRRQTRDVADVFEAAAGLGRYGMTMEDDFRLCPHALRALLYLIDKLNTQWDKWILARVSFGLNGGVMAADDMSAFASYLRDHVRRRPPDHLLVEWFAGERAESARHKNQRPHFCFRHNLFEHLGFHSTLRSSATALFPGCYEELLEPVLFEVEAFKLRACAHDDIWPCKAASDPRYVVPIPWGPLEDLVDRKEDRGPGTNWAQLKQTAKRQREQNHRGIASAY